MVGAVGSPALMELLSYRSYQFALANQMSKQALCTYLPVLPSTEVPPLAPLQYTHTHTQGSQPCAHPATMPLVDPVTMSSSSPAPSSSSSAIRPSTASSVSGKPLEASQLQPVPLHSTAAAQAARHVVPVSVAGLFLAGFGHLVANPVTTMSTALPVVAVLQVVYAFLCLPMAGSAAGKSKKPRPRDKKKAGDGTGPNFIIVTPPSHPPLAPHLLPLAFPC